MAPANQDEDITNQKFRELTTRLENLCSEDPTPSFPAKVVDARIQHARNLLYELIGIEWFTERSKNIRKKYMDIFCMLELLALNYRCALQKRDKTQPVHRRV